MHLAITLPQLFIMSQISIQSEDPNVRHVGKYTFNNRFCLGEGSYGKVADEEYLGVPGKRQSHKRLGGHQADRHEVHSIP